MKIFSRFKKSPPPEVLTVTAVKVQRQAALLTYSNGKTQCWCPYACSFVHEVCEFIPTNKE